MRRNVDEMLADARKNLHRLEAAEAYDAVTNGDAVLIDTRLEGDRALTGVIPGSIWIPLNVLEWRADPDSPHRDPRIGDLDRHVIVICAHGFSSSLAAARLHELGFARACDVVGGFEAWQQAGLPVKPPAGK